MADPLYAINEDCDEWTVPVDFSDAQFTPPRALGSEVPPGELPVVRESVSSDGGAELRVWEAAGGVISPEAEFRLDGVACEPTLIEYGASRCLPSYTTPNWFADPACREPAVACETAAKYVAIRADVCGGVERVTEIGPRLAGWGYQLDDAGNCYELVGGSGDLCHLGAEVDLSTFPLVVTELR